MKNRQQGFTILTVALISIALFAAVTAMVARSSSTPQATTQIWMVQTGLVTQAILLRNKLEYCANKFTSSTAAHAAYPSGTGLSIVSGSSGAPTCPANSLGLLGGTDGVFLPSPPSGFNAWKYDNVTTGAVRIYISASAAPNAATSAALTNAAAALGPGASIVNGSNNADTLQLVIANL